MKKLKFMLLSLALFAVVGAALAFKARFQNDYCVVSTTGNTCPTGTTCTLPSIGFKSTTSSGTKFCTVAYDGNNCNSGAGIACGTAAPKTLISNQ